MFQKPFQNQCPDNLPMLTGFETRFPRAPRPSLPRRGIYKAGGAAESIGFYVLAHKYSSSLVHNQATSWGMDR
jgi:hypothetical protein